MLKRNVMAHNNLNGLVLSCNLSGEVIKLIYDGLNRGKYIEIGQPFISLFDEGSIEKARDFLKKIQETESLLDWQLNMPAEGEIILLHFSGLLLEDHILIIGAPSLDDMVRCMEKISINSIEYSNALQGVMKEFNSHCKEQKTMDSSLYDEIGRLNNELASAQRELTKKNFQLSKLNEQKNQFLGMAAHDLRNPLSVIGMYSDFLIDEASDVLGEEHMEFLQVIRSSSEFMLKLINDLLDVSKIESGKLFLEIEPHNILDVIKHNVELNRVIANSKKINIDFTYSENIPPVILFDRAKIDQVLNNLISNALKFSNPDKNVGVMLERLDDEILVSVKDEGQGIPEDEVHKLFQPFSKTSVQSTEGEKSTGLGLSISKRIVEAHGGKIGVESKYGAGSTFFFTLKINQEGV
jgi:signal transduction histidine kinase